MKQFLLGIDNGGSNIKCALFDTAGHEIASVSKMPHIMQPSPKYMERAPDEVWRLNCDVINETLKKSGINPADISCISLSGYGGGIILTDGQGNCVYPIIASTDSRANEQVRRFTSSGASEEIFSATHQLLWEGQSAALISWFADNDPQTLSKASYAMTVKDYLRFKLTGEFRAELTDASNNNIIDLSSRTYSDELFRVSGLSTFRQFFDSRPVPSDELSGFVTPSSALETGLAAGTPVAAGLYDVSASTLGCGAIRPGTMSVMVGTWVVASTFSKSYQGMDRSTIVTVAPIDGLYLAEQSSPTGTVNLNWYLENFISKVHPEYTRTDLYQLCSEVLRTTPPDAEFEFISPYLYLSDPETVKARLSMLSSCHDEDSILYLVLQGILLSTLRHIRLLEKGGQPIREIYLGGGLASSNEWSQLLCNALNVPLHIVSSSQQGALGAAMCAGVCCGVFDDYYAAADAMAHSAHTLMPTADLSDIFREKLEQYELALNKL